jgi:hypothetical protein
MQDSSVSPLGGDPTHTPAASAGDDASAAGAGRPPALGVSLSALRQIVNEHLRDAGGALARCLDSKLMDDLDDSRAAEPFQHPGLESLAKPMAPTTDDIKYAVVLPQLRRHVLRRTLEGLGTSASTVNLEEAVKLSYSLLVAKTDALAAERPGRALRDEAHEAARAFVLKHEDELRRALDEAADRKVSWAQMLQETGRASEVGRVNEGFISHAYADIFSSVVESLEEYERSLSEAPLTPRSPAPGPLFYYMDLFCAPQRLAVARRCTACVTSFEHRTQREVCPAALCEPRQLRASSSAPNLSRSASGDQPLPRSQSGDQLLSSSPDAAVSSARKPIPPTQLVDEFQTNELAAPRLLLVASNLFDIEPLKRLWVCFEIFTAARDNKPVRILTPRGPDCSLDRLANAGSLDEALTSFANHIDSKDCQAQVAADVAEVKRRLGGEDGEEGLDFVNEKIAEALVKWLAELIANRPGKERPDLLVKLGNFLIDDHPRLALKLAKRAKAALQRILDDLEDPDSEVLRGLSESVAGLFRDTIHALAERSGLTSKASSAVSSRQSSNSSGSSGGAGSS